MSPAQLRYSNMEQKEEASSALNSEIDSGIGEMSPDTNRYPTRSQPKTPSSDVNAVLKREKVKKQLHEFHRLIGGNLLSHEDQIKTSETSPREPNAKGGTCPKCQKVFQDLHSLTLHVKEHNTDDTVCGICSKKLSSASSLDRHMLTHTGEKPFKCKYCPQCFTTNGNMNRHMHTHELEIASRSSGPKAGRASEKKATATLATPKTELDVEGRLTEAKLPQQKDATVFPRRKRMKMTAGGESLKTAEIPVRLAMSTASCESGEKIAVVLDSLKLEELPPSPTNGKESKDKLPVKIETRKSSHELKVVTGFDDLAYMAFSSPKFSLVAQKACEETFRLPHSSQISFKCHLCERFFPCVIALRKHQAFHQNPQGTVCRDCHCHFATPELQEDHMMKHHQSLAGNGDIGNAEFMAALGLHRRPKLSRPIPDDELTNRARVQRFFGSGPARVKEEKRYASKKNGKNEDEDNDPKKPHMGISVPVAGDRNSLNETVADGVAPCRENTRVRADPATSDSPVGLPGSSTIQNSNQESSNDFADIKSIISNVAARPGPSSEGSSSRTPRSGSGSETDNYSLRNYLKGYKRKNHKTVPKVKQHYFCSRCDYKTTEKSSLMRHMLTHDKERPFKCTKCGMTFTTKSNGERHAKTIHRLPKNELITAIDYNLSASGSNKSQKMCKYCYKLFENNRALQHHLRSKTNNCKKKPFICRECRIGFSTKNNCHRHIQNLHKELLHQVKTDVFIIVNKYLKSLARKNKQRKASKQQAASQLVKAASLGESSNSNTFSSESPTSPVQQNFQQHSEVSDSDSLNSDASINEEAPSPMLQQNVEQQTHVDESSNCETSSSDSPCPKSPQRMSQETESSFEGSTNSEFSTSESPSPMPQHNTEVQYSFNEDDRVKAAESLVCLSEGLNLSREFESVVQQSDAEDSPLDLSIRAIDLTERANSSLAQRYNVGHSSFNGSISLALLTSPNTPTLNGQGVVDYSDFATPLNLTKKQNDCSTSSMRQNASTPLAPPPNYKPQPSTSRSQSVSPMLQPKTSKPEILHRCNYCNGKFTQKSNKDRHIRNFHPEHAKPRRNKNFSLSTQDKHASRQASSTLSSATREALLTRVLQHTDGNKQPHVESDHSMNLVIKEEPIPAEEGLTSDLENVDLASVSSVINTANSPKFTQYLTEDCNTYSQRSAEQSSSEPPRKKPKTSKSDGDRSLTCDFPTCNKTFNCRSSLKRHSVIHTGERAFMCPFCHKTFTTNSNMVRHITNKHKVSPPRRSGASPAGQASTSVDPCTSNSSTESSLHEFEPKSGPMPIPTNQPAWPTSFLNIANNSRGNAESVLHGFRSEQTLGELCVSPATRREYPEPNRSPDLPETSQAAMPFASEPSTSLRQANECTFCHTSYKTEADRWNHVKQLHPLEYGKMHGRHVNLPDIVSIWKKNGSAKLKR